MMHPYPKKPGQDFRRRSQLRPGFEGRAGQAMLFLIMVLLIGTFVVVWNFDLHRAVILKMKVQDAGDAAALAAARWQGIQLNTLGELNLIQAALLTEYVDWNIAPEVVALELEAIRDLRTRVQWSGSVVAFAAAQQAALNNGIYANPGYQRMFNEWYDEHGQYIDNPEWLLEFVEFFMSVIDNGVAAVAIRPYSTDYHPLSDRDLYEAIRLAYYENNWCLFMRDSEFMEYLESYSGPQSTWPELPWGWGNPLLPFPYVQERWGSIGGTNIANFVDYPGKEGDLEVWVDQLAGMNAMFGEININAIKDIRSIYDDWDRRLAYVSWATYGDTWTRSWQEYLDEAELSPHYRGGVRDPYDYLAGQSIFRMEAAFVSQFGKGNAMRDRSQSMEWSSAAKVFGEVDGNVPSYFGLILPAFDQVRLVPVPPSAEPIYPKGIAPYKGSTGYLEEGLNALDPDGDGEAEVGGWHGQMLIYFDDPEFRERGLEWLAEHGDECVQDGILPIDVDDKQKGPPYGH